MLERELVTRKTLQRRLAFNAATKPLPVVVASAVGIAALLLGALWLLAVAVGLYVALMLTTFFDGDEAERVGRDAYEHARRLRRARALPFSLAPEIAALIERARIEEQRIVEAIASGGLNVTELAREVDSLTAELERTASRAQLLWDYLEQQQPNEVRRQLDALRRQSDGGAATARARERAAAALEDRLRVTDTLAAELARFRAEMEHSIASLGVVHGQVVRMSVAEGTTARDDVTRDVRALRDRVTAVADEIGATAARADVDAETSADKR